MTRPTPLQTLTQQARALAHGAAGGGMSGAEAEGARQLGVCNACRYCEGFCAVFPAMTRRLEFGGPDMHYLANLCHNCGACLHACQYAPPHEFAINLPQSMARLRGQTYADFAWPPVMGALYRRNGLTVALALAFSLALFLLAAVTMKGSLWHEPLQGNFYAVFPHNLLVSMFGPVFLFVLLALGMGVLRFWRSVAPPDLPRSSGGATQQALAQSITLKHLDGGHGEGCHNEDDRSTHWRRRLHHVTVLGFMLCLASTSVATLYHYLLNWPAPYPLTSLPVLLGTVGGIGLLMGPAGLLWLNLRRHPQHGDEAQQPMDRAFILLLFWVSATGLALLAWRDGPAMALLLAVHLGAVMALFLTLPYGKFAHGAYRVASLIKYQIERRQPNQLQLGPE